MDCGSSPLAPVPYSVPLADFYQEPDSVVRSLSTRPSSPQTAHSVPWDTVLHGNIITGARDFPNWLGRDVSMVAKRSQELHGHMSDCHGKDKLGGNAGNHLSPIFMERFTGADCPPHIPSDAFFSLEVTTLHTSHTMPADIANHLLDFLRTQVISSVTKVSHKKFSIKADVVIAGAMCTLKIRVYQKEENFAIEFQRRSGDCVTFNIAFQQAAQYLESQFGTSVLNPHITEGSALAFGRTL